MIFTQPAVDVTQLSSTPRHPLLVRVTRTYLRQSHGLDVVDLHITRQQLTGYIPDIRVERVWRPVEVVDRERHALGTAQRIIQRVRVLALRDVACHLLGEQRVVLHQLVYAHTDQDLEQRIGFFTGPLLSPHEARTRMHEGAGDPRSFIQRLDIAGELQPRCARVQHVVHVTDAVAVHHLKAIQVGELTLGVIQRLCVIHVVVVTGNRYSTPAQPPVDRHWQMHDVEPRELVLVLRHNRDDIRLRQDLIPRDRQRRGVLRYLERLRRRRVVR